MRPSFLCTLAAAVLIFGCSKSSKTNYSHSYYGNWQMISYQGGFAGSYHKVPADSVVLLSLSPDMSYQQIDNRKVTGSGKYSLTYLPGAGFPDSTWNIQLGSNTTPYFLTLEMDTLWLMESPYDAFSFTYVRQH